MLRVQVIKIGHNSFQIVGTAKQNRENTKTLLLEKVLEFIAVAEKNNGIPRQEMVAHTMPSDIMVYATYEFPSGIETESFLKDCKKI